MNGNANSSSHNVRRVAVFGSGAVGGYFGGRLAEAGEDVTFIARGVHLRALREDGLSVESPAGDFHIKPVRATDDPSDVGPVDVVLLGVKAWQVHEAARAMRPLVGADTMVLPLQNGVEAPSELVDVLGAEPVLGGLCKIAAAAVSPGRIRHMGIDPVVTFGELDGRRSERIAALKRVFDAATGVRAEISEDILAAMWGKFVFICGVSGLGAITRVPVGVFRAQPETRALLAKVMEEVGAVAAARGIDLGENSVGRTLAFIDDLPAQATASMHRDIVEGRPSELEYQNGAVVRLGQAAGVETPVNRLIYHCLLPLERQARG